MKEYKVTGDDYMAKPDPKKSQETADRMSVDGWKLVSASAVTGSGGGRVLMFWERDKA